MKKIKIIKNSNKSKKIKFEVKNNLSKIANCLGFSKDTNYYFIYILLFILVFIFYEFNKNHSSSFHHKNNLSPFNQANTNVDIKLALSIMKKYQKTEIDWPLPNEIVFKPALNEEELKAFLYFMKKDNIYFEFGSGGGSTNIASFYKLKTYSVELDINIHQKLKDSNIQATYITVDLKAQKLGYPGQGTTLEDWKKYIEAYKEEYNADIIFIDGRFRVACCLNIFSKIRNDSIVLIHDYENRKEYHIIERFYQKIQSWDRLSAFIKRKNIHKIPNDIYNRYLTVQFI